jgi:GcrA cell cycle regulator
LVGSVSRRSCSVRKSHTGDLPRVGEPAATRAQSHPGSPWPERDAQLLTKRAEGKSAGVIAEEMGLSPGKVSGRLWRLKRLGQAPVIASPSARKPAILTPEAEARRVAKMKATKALQHADRRVAATRVRAGQAHAVKPEIAAPPPRQAPLPVLAGRVVTCCWPIGEPGTSSFRFCGDPSEPGRPYCHDHVSVAYVRASVLERRVGA